MTNAVKTVPQLCEGIAHHQLQSSADLATVRSRWFRPERPEVNDPEQFCRWLVLNHDLTEFVVRVVSSRKSGQLVLNQYRLIDHCSAGPLAGAYLAIDPLERRVALEVLSARSAADPALLADFQQRARRAMQVEHPNVGRILDIGQAQGFHYLVEEYYEGQTVEEILHQRGKLPCVQAAKLMALAFAGVEALHAAGVPAGELRARCILLTAAGKDTAKQRTVKLLHAGFPHKLFGETAINRGSVSPARRPSRSTTGPTPTGRRGPGRRSRRRCRRCWRTSLTS